MVVRRGDLEGKAGRRAGGWASSTLEQPRRHQPSLPCYNKLTNQDPLMGTSFTIACNVFSHCQTLHYHQWCSSEHGLCASRQPGVNRRRRWSSIVLVQLSSLHLPSHLTLIPLPPLAASPCHPRTQHLSLAPSRTSGTTLVHLFSSAPLLAFVSCGRARMVEGH